jgi:hypothetical protein
MPAPTFHFLSLEEKNICIDSVDEAVLLRVLDATSRDHRAVQRQRKREFIVCQNIICADQPNS